MSKEETINLATFWIERFLLPESENDNEKAEQGSYYQLLQTLANSSLSLNQRYQKALGALEIVNIYPD